MNCIHGIDSRFCAVCNKQIAPPRRAIGNVSLEEILQFLNEEEVRATYGAVAEVLGLIARSIDGERLGPPRPSASWIVNSETGLPTHYSQDDWHPRLLSKAEIITNGRALLLRMSSRRTNRAGSGVAEKSEM